MLKLHGSIVRYQLEIEADQGDTARHYAIEALIMFPATRVPVYVPSEPGFVRPMQVSRISHKQVGSRCDEKDFEERSRRRKNLPEPIGSKKHFFYKQNHFCLSTPPARSGADLPQAQVFTTFQTKDYASAILSQDILLPNAKQLIPTIRNFTVGKNDMSPRLEHEVFGKYDVNRFPVPDQAPQEFEQNMQPQAVAVDVAMHANAYLPYDMAKNIASGSNQPAMPPVWPNKEDHLSNDGNSALENQHLPSSSLNSFAPPEISAAELLNRAWSHVPASIQSSVKAICQITVGYAKEKNIGLTTQTAMCKFQDGVSQFNVKNKGAIPYYLAENFYKLYAGQIEGKKM